ncbi:MAG: HEPN domain-containing protein [Nitrospira sp.]|nr:HEPN domain-containing protein [Nitrospira sp.]
MDGLNIQEKIVLSDSRFIKSKESLTDAHTSFNAGMYKTSVNRSYYAVLHAARSLLILKGVDPVRHNGVKTMLSLHFVKAAILTQEAIRIFRNLMTLRTDVDYSDFETIDKNDAENALKQAERFIEIMEPVRQVLIKEMSSIG